MWLIIRTSSSRDIFFIGKKVVSSILFYVGPDTVIKFACHFDIVDLQKWSSFGNTRTKFIDLAQDTVNFLNVGFSCRYHRIENTLF